MPEESEFYHHAVLEMKELAARAGERSLESQHPYLTRFAEVHAVPLPPGHLITFKFKPQHYRLTTLVERLTARSAIGEAEQPEGVRDFAQNLAFVATSVSPGVEYSRSVHPVDTGGGRRCYLLLETPEKRPFTRTLYFLDSNGGFIAKSDDIGGAVTHEVDPGHSLTEALARLLFAREHLPFESQKRA